MTYLADPVALARRAIKPRLGIEQWVTSLILAYNIGILGNLAKSIIHPIFWLLG
jgi:hypothetical protein